MKLFDLSGRTALVTGSSKGIGYALAQARIVVNARDAGNLQAAQSALRAQGVDVETAAFNVTDAGALEAGIARIEQAIGAIDIRVNNASMQHRGAFAEFPIDAWGDVPEMAGAAIFLASDASSFVSGHILYVDAWDHGELVSAAVFV